MGILMRPPKPPMNSASVMALFLYCNERMKEEISLMKWQKEKEKITKLKQQIIEILQWEIIDDLEKLMEEDDD